MCLLERMFPCVSITVGETVDYCTVSKDLVRTPGTEESENFEDSRGSEVTREGARGEPVGKTKEEQRR